MFSFKFKAVLTTFAMVAVLFSASVSFASEAPTAAQIGITLLKDVGINVSRVQVSDAWSLIHGDYKHLKFNINGDDFVCNFELTDVVNLGNDTYFVERAEIGRCVENMYGMIAEFRTTRSDLSLNNIVIFNNNTQFRRATAQEIERAQ